MVVPDVQDVKYLETVASSAENIRLNLFTTRVC